MRAGWFFAPWGMEWIRFEFLFFLYNYNFFSRDSSVSSVLF